MEESPAPCHVRSVIGWSRELGFTEKKIDVPCEPNEPHRAVKIGPEGELTTEPLVYVSVEP